MIYQLDVQIPPATLRSDPLTRRITVSPGHIVEFQYYWRPGAGYLCGWRGIHHEVQRWPYTPDAWFPSVRGLVRWTEDYALDTEPYEIVIEAFNEDEVYAHRLWVAFNVLVIEATDRLLDLASWLAAGKRVRR